MVRVSGSEKAPMDTEKIKLNTVTLSFIAVILIDIALMKFLGLFQIPPYLRIALVRLVEIAAVLIIVVRLNDGPKAIGLSKRTAATGIKRGIIWSLCFGTVVGVAFIIIALTGTNPFGLFKTRMPAATGDLIFFLIAGGLIAPVAEEIFFRGILYGYFRKNGAFFAAIISTLIFVSLHSLSGNVPVVQIVGGLVFALSYEIEKSLFTPIIIHASGNIAIFTLSLL